MTAHRRILVVDDEKNVRFTVTHALRSDGFDVDGAANGIEGLRMSAEGRYDLLLVDLRMPGMNGIEMLRELRQRDPDMPAVIITAYGVPGQLVEAAGLGAIDCIRKPFSITTLRGIVRQVLERAELPGDFRPVSVADHVCIGKYAMMRGDLSAAEHSLARALEIDRSSSEAHLLNGLLALLQARDGDARESFRTALRYDPANRNASEYLAWYGS